MQAHNRAVFGAIALVSLLPAVVSACWGETLWWVEPQLHSTESEVSSASDSEWHAYKMAGIYKVFEIPLKPCQVVDYSFL